MSLDVWCCFILQVTLDQMKAKQEYMVQEREKQLAKKQAEHRLQLQQERKKEKQQRKQVRFYMLSYLHNYPLLL